MSFYAHYKKTFLWAVFFSGLGLFLEPAECGLMLSVAKKKYKLPASLQELTLFIQTLLPDLHLNLLTETEEDLYRLSEKLSDALHKKHFSMHASSHINVHGVHVNRIFNLLKTAKKNLEEVVYTYQTDQMKTEEYRFNTLPDQEKDNPHTLFNTACLDFQRGRTHLDYLKKRGKDLSILSLDEKKKIKAQLLEHIHEEKEKIKFFLESKLAMLTRQEEEAMASSLLMHDKREILDSHSFLFYTDLLSSILDRNYQFFHQVSSFFNTKSHHETTPMCDLDQQKKLLEAKNIVDTIALMIKPILSGAHTAEKETCRALCVLTALDLGLSMPGSQEVMQKRLMDLSDTDKWSVDALSSLLMPTDIKHCGAWKERLKKFHSRLQAFFKNPQNFHELLFLFPKFYEKSLRKWQSTLTEL